MIAGLMTILASTSKLIPYGAAYWDQHSLFKKQYSVVWGLRGYGNLMRVTVGVSEFTAGILLFMGKILAHCTAARSNACSRCSLLQCANRQ